MLLCISGSLRQASVNTKLLHEAARIYGGEAVFGDLRMPLYDADLQDSIGVTPEAVTLAEQIDTAEAVAISTPEYNYGIPGVLKNALDWISRVDGNPWRGKPVALMSAAAGRAGGARALYALQQTMLPFRARILAGPEVMVARAASEFDEDGRLIGEGYVKFLGELMMDLKAEAAR